MAGGCDLDRIAWDADYRRKIRGEMRDPGIHPAGSDKREMVVSGREGMDRPSIPFKVAFQPIIDVRSDRPMAFEALVRGTNGESLTHVLESLSAAERFEFDHLWHRKAMAEAVSLQIDRRLSLNILPGALNDPAFGLEAALDAAAEVGLSPDRLIFELSEREYMRGNTVVDGLGEYADRGILSAIDDFGAGFAGLGLLVFLQPDILKMDMSVIRGIDADPVRCLLLEGVVAVCEEMAIDVVAKGVETEAELRTLKSLGVNLMQGYYLQKPI